MTATPGQRIVMLFDRLLLDLTRAATADVSEFGQHCAHASQIVGELFGSLDTSAGGPVDNLAAIYGYLLKELMSADPAGLRRALPALTEIVAMLRTTWATAAEQTDSTGRGASDSSERALVGNWVG
jgi:flagellar secretion chaperone FliS